MKQMFYELKLFLRKKSVFLKIFFLLLLLSMFSMVAVIFFINSVVVREQNSYIEEMQENQLVQASELVDLRIDVLENNMTQFLESSDVVAVMVNPDNQDSELHYRILQMLSSYLQDNDSLLQTFLYLPYAGDVYHSNGNFLSLEQVLEADIIRSYVAQRDENVNLEDIRQNVFRWKDRVFLVADYCVPNFIGALFFEIDTEYYFELIQNGSSHSEILVMDEADQWLFHEPDDTVKQEWRNGGYVSYISEKLGWRYLCSVEVEYAAPGISYVFSIVLPFIAGYLLLSLLITFRITYNVYRPIGRLLAIATKDGRQDPVADQTYRNEMDYLELAYSDTLEKNQDQKELLASISNDILEQLFRNILTGTVTNMTEVGRTLRGLDRTDLQQRRYLVMVVSFRNAEGGEPSILENSLYQRSLKNVAEGWKKSDTQIWSMFMEETVMSLILLFPEHCNDGKALMHAAELEEHIYQSTKDFPYQIRMGKGRIYGELTGLRYSWQEAMDDIRYQSTQTSHATEEASPVQTEHQKQYYQERGNQVADIAERRTSKEAMEVGSMLLAEIVGVPAINQMAYFQMLLQPVRERLIGYGVPEETIRETEAADGEEKLSSLNSKETRRQYMTETYSRMLKLLQSSSQNKKYRYVKAAQDYIADNYGNGSLSLNEVADAIGISSAYLSEVFSEVTKTGFTIYLNRYRVERAKEFLAKMNAPTGEIGELCGFNSAQNFTRVFKKYADVTPGQYRDELRRRAEEA